MFPESKYPDFPMYICGLYPEKVKDALLPWTFHAALNLKIQKITTIVLTKTKFWSISQAKAFHVVGSQSSSKQMSNLMALPKAFGVNYPHFLEQAVLILTNRI